MNRSGCSISTDNLSGSVISGEISDRSANTICIETELSVYPKYSILVIDSLLSKSLLLPGMLMLTPKSSGFSPELSNLEASFGESKGSFLIDLLNFIVMRPVELSYTLPTFSFSGSFF